MTPSVDIRRRRNIDIVGDDVDIGEKNLSIVGVLASAPRMKRPTLAGAKLRLKSDIFCRFGVAPKAAMPSFLFRIVSGVSVKHFVVRMSYGTIKLITS